MVFWLKMALFQTVIVLMERKHRELIAAQHSGSKSAK